MSSEMSAAGEYHAYLLSKISPHVKSRVLEIGVGYGQYTEKLLGLGCQVLGTDIDEECLTRVRRVHGMNSSLELLRLDLDSPDEHLSECRDFGPDTVICLNVLEHVANDGSALQFLFDVCVPNGKVVLIVPACGWIFNRLDREAGHVRRYGRAALCRKVAHSGGIVEKSCYFNHLGLIGWLVAGLVNGMLRRDNNLDSAETNALIRFYNRCLVGVSRGLDNLIPRAIPGLSLLIVASPA